jgi:hypothetical protein
MRNLFRGGPVTVLNWGGCLQGPDVCSCVDLYGLDVTCFD